MHASMVEILVNSLSCDLYGNHKNLALENLEVYIWYVTTSLLVYNLVQIPSPQKVCMELLNDCTCNYS